MHDNGCDTFGTSTTHLGPHSIICISHKENRSHTQKICIEHLKWLFKHGLEVAKFPFVSSFYSELKTSFNKYIKYIISKDNSDLEKAIKKSFTDLIKCFSRQ